MDDEQNARQNDERIYSRFPDRIVVRPVDAATPMEGIQNTVAGKGPSGQNIDTTIRGRSREGSGQDLPSIEPRRFDTSSVYPDATDEQVLGRRSRLVEKMSRAKRANERISSKVPVLMYVALAAVMSRVSLLLAVFVLLALGGRPLSFAYIVWGVLMLLSIIVFMHLLMGKNAHTIAVILKVLIGINTFSLAGWLVLGGLRFQVLVVLSVVEIVMLWYIKRQIEDLDT